MNKVDRDKAKARSKAIRAYRLHKNHHPDSSIAEILGIPVRAVQSRVLLGERLYMAGFREAK